ncbi:hypothetical protein PFLmoz3_00275 [Pseudomonas fluorescens]|uniref:Uncharacterized protein n=1 Tax=Pseudomonas fluorescens TaxID=294 RepID=A0A109LLZ9_PSEFL|nr:hypothetical protein PFLmoz3_00275 [Pseudomonas fluorescens]
MLHSQVGEVTGGVVGAAAGDGHRHLRRLAAQAAGDFFQHRVQALQLGRDGVAGGQGLFKHF